jgi:hypothetical protein
MLKMIGMTHTEFITREKHGGQHPLFKGQFRARDGALILAFLAAFVGLVLLLSK